MTIFPLANVESYFRSLSGNVERHGDTLRWPSHDGITEFSFERIDQATPDGGVVSELVILRHSSPFLYNLSSDLASKLNRWGTLSALVQGEVGRFQLAARIGIFSEDRDAAERLYAPLICQEAGVIGWHAAMLASGEFQSDPSRSPLSMTDQAPPTVDAEFEAIKSESDRRGLFGSLGKRYFAVEFPWEVGAVSNLFRHDDEWESLQRSGISEEYRKRAGGKTSLLQIRVATHPIYGNGVQCTLEIPSPANDEVSERLSHALNGWELSRADLPPLMGAWCPGPRALAFGTFVPTQFWVPGLLQNLFGWGSSRHSSVRELLAGN